MSCKSLELAIGFLAAVMLAPPGARGDDFPSIKAKQPDAYEEVAGLAGRNPEFKKRLAQDDVAKNGLAGESLCLALWSAGQECKWQWPDLAARFPALCHLGGVVGMADADGDVPKLVCTLDGGASFCTIHIQSNYSESRGKPYINSPRANRWKLEQVDERSYLVLDRWERQLPGENFQRHVITRILIDGIYLVEKEKKVVRVPMPSFIGKPESEDQDESALAPGAKATDLAEVKASRAGVYDEVMGLAARHAALGRLLGKWGLRMQALGGGNLIEALRYAAQESDWSQEELFKKFPNMCRAGSVAGIADEGSNVPKLVFAADNSEQFEMLCNDEREMKDEGKGDAIYNDGFRYDYTLREIEGRSYLVLSRWARMHAGDKSQYRELVYLLIDGGKFVKTRDQEVEVPMPSERDAGMRDAEKARLEAAIVATNTSGIDFPSIKEHQPEVYPEILALASRHAGLKQCLEDESGPKEGMDEISLCQSLFYAAHESDWKLPELEKKFPQLCRVAGVIGMADEGSAVPELVFTGGDGFLLLYENDAKMASIDSCRVNGMSNWKMEEVNGRSYLVAGSLYNDGGVDEWTITRLLIDGGKFVEKGNKKVERPLF